jgi:hypothetical protein
VIKIFNVHFGNMGDIFETHEVAFEVYIEDKLTNRQQMQAPKEMIIANFLQTAKQIQADKRPIKIKIIRPEEIWDKFEQRRRILNNEIELSNNAMVAWEANKNG